MPTPRLPRILIYCHNAHGLGHVVRSLRIAAALRPGERCRCRLVTGCRFLDKLALDRLEVDRRIETVQLPALRPGSRRRLVPVDGGSLGQVLQQRSHRIAAEVENFRPHVVLVDHNPLGLVGELARTLDAHAGKESGPRFVWGVRDIWGTEDYLRKMARYGEGPAAATGRMERYYGAMAYTDDGWIDTFEEYAGLEMPALRRSVGFVAGTIEPRRNDADDAGAPRLVALSGGGAQAEALCEMLLAALGPRLDAGRARLRLVVGPFTPAEGVRRLVGDRPNVEVWPEGSVERAVRDAAAVVSRVGYNTAYTLVRSDLPLVFVPIRADNQEQTMRAHRLAELEGIEAIADDAPPEVLAATLGRALDRYVEKGPVDRKLPFSTAGAETAAGWLLELAEEAS